jgi:hypothetical protein
MVRVTERRAAHMDNARRHVARWARVVVSWLIAACLVVVAWPAGTASAALPLTITKAFAPSAIPLNGITTLTFTIHNPDSSTPAAGVAFTDVLPLGLFIATPSNLFNTCGGTPVANQGTFTVSLVGGMVGAGANCTVSASVTGSTVGTFHNVSGAVTSTNGGTGNTASATLIVANVTIAKAFGAPTIPLNGTTPLTFTIHSTDGPLTGVAFTDNLPAGLAVATPTALTNGCGGAATATAGSTTVSLSGGTLAALASCTVSVNVVGTTLGVKNNSVSVSSTNAGAGNTATATVNVVAPVVASNPAGATARFTG